MKQIYLIDEHMSSKQNGVGTYVRHFVQMFDDADCQVNILSFNAEVKELCISVKDGVCRYDIPYCAQGNFMKAGELICPLLSLYIEDKKDNVFFVNHSPCSHFLKAIRTSFPKSKIVFTIHDQGWTSPLLGNSGSLKRILGHHKVYAIDNDTARYVRDFCKEEHKMYKVADAIICLSHSTLQLLHEVYGVPANKLYYIPNCFINKFNELTPSKSEAREKLNIGEHEKILLFVGRPEKAKGIFELLGAFERMCNTIKDVRLVIVGEIHSLEEFTKLTPTSSSRITYTGLISPEQLVLWYASADIGVLPSYTEQCSYAALEMMHSPGIVITTDGWGLDDVFTKENAIIAHIQKESSDIKVTQFEENLYSALVKAISLEKVDLDELRIQCRTLLDNRYNIGRVSLEYKKLINDITSAI